MEQVPLWTELAMTLEIWLLRMTKMGECNDSNLLINIFNTIKKCWKFNHY